MTVEVQRIGDSSGALQLEALRAQALDALVHRLLVTTKSLVCVTAGRRRGRLLGQRSFLGGTGVGGSSGGCVIPVNQ